MSELCIAFKQKKLCQVSFATSELFFTNKFRSNFDGNRTKMLPNGRRPYLRKQSKTTKKKQKRVSGLLFGMKQKQAHISSREGDCDVICFGLHCMHVSA